MVRNSGKGGKKHKRSAAKSKHNDSKELVFKEDGQEYAQIKDPLGNCRFSCQCQDGKLRMGSVRGKMHKKIWIARGDIVLVGLREFQDDKCDIIHKYTNEEGNTLKKYEEITFQVETEEDMDGFRFGEEDTTQQIVEDSDGSEDINIDTI